MSIRIITYEDGSKMEIQQLKDVNGVHIERISIISPFNGRFKKNSVVYEVSDDNGSFECFSSFLEAIKCAKHWRIN